MKAEELLKIVKDANPPDNISCLHVELREMSSILRERAESIVFLNDRKLRLTQLAAATNMLDSFLKFVELTRDTIISALERDS